MRKLTVLNAETARFECVFPTCGGACCKGSRPPATPAEVAHLQALLPRVLPRLRPSARRAVETRGFVTNRKKSGNATVAIDRGECVFFHDGCTLHVLAVEEGLDRFTHKPWACTTFPLERHDASTWHIRQHGEHGEAWSELPCLSPEASDERGVDTLGAELAFAAELAEGGSQTWRFGPVGEEKLVADFASRPTGRRAAFRRGTVRSEVDAVHEAAGFQETIGPRASAEPMNEVSVGSREGAPSGLDAPGGRGWRQPLEGDDMSHAPSPKAAPRSRKTR